MENQASIASSSVYPLYRGVHFQPRKPIIGFLTTHEDSNRIIVGKPVFQTVHERLSPPFTSFSRFNLKKTVGEEPQPPSSPVNCDLSLRLGLVSGSSGCRKGLTLVNEVESGQRKELSFFPLNSKGEDVENSVSAALFP
ncbi:unnamed protein product [Lactuca virosa]|uniref:Uncharacterized protein n=1 Tax=Lactuca virosa TaxID=75947 RepID=A0AAU9NVH4_9ASTR|nr:unnamed protein product [Lactuca virosa]